MTREDMILLLQNQLLIMMWMRGVNSTAIDAILIDEQISATERRIHALQDQTRGLGGGGIVPQHEQFMRFFGEVPP